MKHNFLTFSMVLPILATAAFTQAASSVHTARIGKQMDPMNFAIHDHDTIVFYGDSITDNAPYTTDIEAFLSLRYPKWHLHFMNAGVGGDRVTGGWMGPIDQRMTRDLFSRKPSVITCMLGMNDAGYKPFDDGLFNTYKTGYQHMVDRILKEAPKANVWLIQPSPYDDVTRKPGWDPGYNSVLESYAKFVGELSSTNHFGIVDQNTPIVNMLTAANAADPTNAQKLIPDRVHPCMEAHLLMADDILKAWNASRIVGATTVDVSKLARAGEGYSFPLKEDCLPMPIDRKDDLEKLVLQSSTVSSDLNSETLTVTNLPPGNYAVKIDDVVTGTFSSDALSAGLDLSVLDTPMMRQAQKVMDMTQLLTGLRYNRWRTYEFGLQSMPLSQKNAAINGLIKMESEIENNRFKAAQPVSHTVSITAAN